MLEHKFSTRYAELVRCEALRYKGLARIRPDVPEYEELYFALAFAAHCAEREMSNADR